MIPRDLVIRLCLISSALILSGQVSAQQIKATDAQRAHYLLTTRGEVVISFVKPFSCSLADLSSFLSIDNYHLDTVTAYAGEAGFRKFLALNIPYEVRKPPSLQSALHKPEVLAQESWRNQYPSYSRYTGLMDSFAMARPELSRLTQFGTSINGRKLLALKISDNPAIHENEPVIILTSSIHGDETVGYVLMLRMIDYLLANYDSDERIRHLVDEAEIWINPLANPDGTYFMSDTSVAGATRFNANHTDLNRNFPDLQDPDWENRPREPENLAMMSFMNDCGVVLAANFHGGAEVVNYPWDTWEKLHADDDWYRLISRAYADTVHQYGVAEYMNDLDNGITNGYAWYPLYGGRQDYVNYFLHAREVTIELSSDKMPAEDLLEDFWKFHRQSLLHYMERSLTGITGTVTDSLTQQAVQAEIWIENHDKDNSFVLSSALDGTFYRLTSEGQYEVSITAQGYLTQKKPVAVAGGALSPLHAKLVPANMYELHPNPFTDMLYLYVGESGNDLKAEFFDLSGRKVLQTSQPVINAGTQSIDTKALSRGTWLVRITCGSLVIRQVVLKMP